MGGLPSTCTFLIILETCTTLYLNKSRSIHSPGLHPLALAAALPQLAVGLSCEAAQGTDEHSRTNVSPSAELFPRQLTSLIHFPPAPYFSSCHCCTCILKNKEKSH